MTHPQLTPSNEAYIQSSLYRIIAMLEEEFHASYTTMEANDNFYITQAVDYIKKSPFLDITVTDIPIANIATSCGYQNPFAFSRAFKKETGMTPREYREKYHHAEDLLDC